MNHVSSPHKAQLIFIVGPTAVGKTSTAIHLAEVFQTEIVSADSRQVYRELDIGVARPSIEELQTVPHHLIAHRSIHKNYTVSEYEHEAHAAIKDIVRRTGKCIVVGGSGLFIDAIHLGLDHLPPADPNTRKEYETILAQPDGRVQLLEQLKLCDPEYYKNMDRANNRRIIRALEVYRSTGKPMSVLIGNRAPIHSYDSYGFLLNMDRHELYTRIEQRYNNMLQQGLRDEIAELYPHRNLAALQTVGYREWFKYLDGEISHKRAIEIGKQKSRNYAKRQLTWFRHHGSWETTSPQDLIDLFPKEL